MKSIYFGRGICGELATAESMEWLVTNGIGGYASGTVANLLTRRYHGLLVAALNPPLGRTLLVSKLDETVDYNGRTYPIFSNRWADILVEPHGYRYIERFHLEGMTPVWTFSFGDAQLERRIWMQPGENTTYVFYRLRRATSPLTLVARAMVNYRDFHSETHAGDWVMHVKRVQQGLRVGAFEDAAPFCVLSDRAAINQEHHWYRNFSLKKEPYRGPAVMEDHLNIGEFRITLAQDETVTFVISTEPSPNLDGESALAVRHAYEKNLIALAPHMPVRLLLAADQFIVKRPYTELAGNSHSDKEEGWSIIAGYQWLRDYGRDVMVSLPGLLLATGRFEEARSILKSYSKHVSEGMLPSHLPDTELMGNFHDDLELIYKAADVSLWYLEAIRAYFKETGDIELLTELYPVLTEIIDWHERGTRYHIAVDPVDGLLYAGKPGLPLTWMDAKFNDWAITPRTGKAVEINALWYNGLLSMADFARALGQPFNHFEALAEKTRVGFARFWNPELGFLYDVLDTPAGNDATLRPNQLLAVSLCYSPLDQSQQKAVVDMCVRRLLTPLGLRSLSPDEPGYVGHYGGDAYQRDHAYHQGSVWSWLIGPFVSAHLRVYKDATAARSFLEPFFDHLSEHGLGSVSEIFDGDAPFTPHGCIAQAWSVAEVLRVWREIYAFDAEAVLDPGD